MTKSLENPRKDFKINALGSLNLLECVRKYTPNIIIIYSSTNKVYGDLEYLSYKETKTRYVLITHYSDNTTGQKCFRKFLNDDKLIRWFGQNMDFNHPKVEGIPIGLSNKIYKDNIQIIKDILKLRVIKKNKCYMNFNILTNNKRNEVFLKLKEKPFVYNSKRVSFEQYIKDIKSHRFIICPPGNGIDCHRIWGSLIMDSIPLVEKSTAMSYYSDLPIIFIGKWDDLNEDFLEEQYRKIAKKKYNLEKMYFSYWEKRIKDLKNNNVK